MTKQLSMPLAPNPEVKTGDLVTKIMFDRSMYYQWHDKCWDNTLRIVMGEASAPSEWQADDRCYVVPTNRTSVLSQVGDNYSEYDVRRDYRSGEEDRCGIIIVDPFVDGQPADLIADIVSLNDETANRFTKRTIIGESMLAQVQIELAKRSADDNKASRVAHCLTYSLGELFRR